MDGSDTRGIAGPSYRLKVKDFGPITAADLNLLPLTVLVGPSNTGKSYLATLVYALHRCFGDQGKFPDLPDQDAPDPDLFSLGELGEWAKAIASAPSEASNLPAFPPSVESYVRSFLEAAPGVGRRLGTELARCFGVARVQDLVRQPQTGVAQSEIEIEIPRPAEGGVFGYDIALNRDGPCGCRPHPRTLEPRERPSRLGPHAVTFSTRVAPWTAMVITSRAASRERTGSRLVSAPRSSPADRDGKKLARSTAWRVWCPLSAKRPRRHVTLSGCSGEFLASPSHCCRVRTRRPAVRSGGRLSGPTRSIGGRRYGRGSHRLVARQTP